MKKKKKSELDLIRDKIKKIKNFSGKKRLRVILTLVASFVLLAGLASAYFLLGTNSDLRQQASVYSGCSYGEDGTYACSSYSQCVKCVDGHSVKTTSSSCPSPCNTSKRSKRDCAGGVSHGDYACGGIKPSSCKKCDDGSFVGAANKCPASMPCGQKQPLPTEKPGDRDKPTDPGPTDGGYKSPTPTKSPQDQGDDRCSDHLQRSYAVGEYVCSGQLGMDVAGFCFQCIRNSTTGTLRFSGRDRSNCKNSCGWREVSVPTPTIKPNFVQNSNQDSWTPTPTSKPNFVQNSNQGSWTAPPAPTNSAPVGGAIEGLGESEKTPTPTSKPNFVQDSNQNATSQDGGNIINAIVDAIVDGVRSGGDAIEDGVDSLDDTSDKIEDSADETVEQAVNFAMYVFLWLSKL